MLATLYDLGVKLVGLVVLVLLAAFLLRVSSQDSAGAVANQKIIGGLTIESEDGHYRIVLRAHEYNGAGIWVEDTQTGAYSLVQVLPGMGVVGVGNRKEYQHMQLDHCCRSKAGPQPEYGTDEDLFFDLLVNKK